MSYRFPAGDLSVLLLFRATSACASLIIPGAIWACQALQRQKKVLNGLAVNRKVHTKDVAATKLANPPSNSKAKR